MSNDEISERMQTRRKLILNIKERQLKFLGYVMRKVGLENLILTGRIEGKRQGRATHDIPSGLKEVDDRTWPRGSSKWTKHIESYKGWGGVESQDRLRPKGTRHIKEKKK